MKPPDLGHLKHLKDEVFATRRRYIERKQEIFETGVTSIEAKRNVWLFAVIFVGLVVLIWIAVIFRPIEIDELNNQFGLITPGAVVFFSSYFAFFFVSKLVVKPSPEELADDTSYFALFSACDRRASRGLAAGSFGAINTFVFFFYLLRYIFE